MESFLFSIASLLAIATHGIGHLLCARAVGVSRMRVQRTGSGFRLIGRQAFPSYEAELFCALGGPLANALCALIARLLLLPLGIFPRLTVLLIPISLYLAMLNLLPLSGFDGYRILHAFLCARHRFFPSLTPERADALLHIPSALVLILLWLFAVYILLRRGSALSLYLFCLQLFFSTRSDELQNKSICTEFKAFANRCKHSGDNPG